MVRAVIVALLLAAGVLSSPSPASAQTTAGAATDVRALETRLERRFQIVPIASGVVLTPKFSTRVRSVEVTDNAIAVDGVVVTGAELRDRLGADADLIFQVSYLDAAARRALLGVTTGQPAAPAAEPNARPEIAAPAPAETNDRPRRNRRDDLVRFGGNVKVETGEEVSGDVVAIGGNGDVDGGVLGDVAVIGGNLTLGPHAHVRGDVTIVGGHFNRDPGAITDGQVTEVGVGDAFQGTQVGRTLREAPWRRFIFSPYIGLAGTMARVVLLMLLAGLVLLVARTPVSQVAERAGAEPVKAWAIGFLAELLFGPIVVLTVVVLAISIIGIPLLVLLPVAIVGVLLISLLGFTSVAYRVGQLVEARFDQLRDRPYLATIVGIVVIVSPLLLARVLDLVGGLGFFTGVLVVVGFVVEYLAWTTGLGAVALVRFGKPVGPSPVDIVTPPSTSLTVSGL